jgi:uncharacterized protein YfcZ (UPF0381/DUF406 family)
MDMKTIIAKMVSVYAEIEANNEDLKALKEEAKAIGADPAIVAAVARSIFQGKSSELKVKSETIVEMLEQNG